MENPIISVIATAIHTEFWLKLHKALSINNCVPFEIVFVGNVMPTFPLPSNFVYIYSTAKPAQCLEISCRNAQGEYVMIAADDHMFQINTLNILYSYVHRMRNTKAVVMARYSDTLGKPATDDLLTFYSQDPRSPVVGVNTIFKRSIWKELGGIDRRFTTVKSDLDMQMRFYEAGGHPFIVPNITTEEYSHRGRNRLINLGGLEDSNFLYSLWVKNGIVVDNRLDSVQPFTEEEIPIVR